MLGRVTLLALVLAAAAPAFADTKSDDSDDAEQVVVVNASAKLGDLGQISRLKKMLASRGLLYKLPDNKLEAQLDGRNVLVNDLDQIKEAYTNGDYATAKKAIEVDERRILEDAANGDPVPALARLAMWRGMIAATTGDHEEAIKQFRCAYRLNPAWAPDKRLVSPRMRSLIKRAHVEPGETAVLGLDIDPSGAKVAIDGGEPKPVRARIQLAVGMHLVQIIAPGRRAYAEVVDVSEARPPHIEVALDEESKYDRAARLVDETAAAPAGKPRLKSAKGIARLTSWSRMLVIEDGGDDHITVRLYDVDARKVSEQFELEGDAPSSDIAKKIKAALDPENLIDPSSIAVANARAEHKSWYEHWYVWAGVAAVAVGGYAGYEYMNREPTMLRGF